MINLQTGPTCVIKLAATALLLVLVGCSSDGFTDSTDSASGSANRADIIGATRTAPGTVGLSVGSCNQDPFVAEIEQTDPGTYEVLVQARLRDNGEDCADGVTIDIDPDHPMVVIIDRTSGQSFDLLGTGQPTPLGLNGVWRMTTVDIGHLVTVGQTTVEIPEIAIRAGEESGVIEGNFGCNHLSIEVTFATDTMTGRPETLEGTLELCAIPDGSDQLVLTESTLLDLLSGEQPAQMYLSGDHLEIATPETNAVFERVSQ